MATLMLNLCKIKIEDLQSLGLRLHNARHFQDARGSMTVEFEGSFSIEEKVEIGFKRSLSKPFVGRGLHYQPEPFLQTKLISVKRGAVFDFIWDPSNLDNNLYMYELSENDDLIVQIPSNFAHGYITLSSVEMEYRCIGAYSPENEKVYSVLEDAANELSFGPILLSEKDKNGIKKGVRYAKLS